MTVSDKTEAVEPVDSMSTPEVKKTRVSVKKSSGPSRVVGRGTSDEVSFDKFEAIASGRSRTRKSLTLHHLQARLTELGYPDAGNDLDGQYGALTRGAVEAWQKSVGHEEGPLTREQFTTIFEGDSNVTVIA